MAPDHTRRAHPTEFWASQCGRCGGRTLLFGLPARGSEGAPVLFDVGSSRLSSLTTCEAAGSLCVSSACEQVNL